MTDIQTLSKQFGINAEVKNTSGNFPVFMQNVLNKSICVLCDENTEKYSSKILSLLRENGNQATCFTYSEKEPVADEKSVSLALAASKNSDYLLAIGSGTLNDVAKYTGFLSKKKSGILATAPSMDGFSSGVTPLIENGFKITKNAQTASDILIDYDLLKTAPLVMTGAGVGDILAKFCSLADWKISNLLFEEEYNLSAAELMRKALDDCNDNIVKIQNGGEEGIASLMNALLVSGYAMVLAGNSRPASGAEHHMSHFLEMDFLKRGKRIPLHGIKVGLGTMVSLHLYREVSRFDFEGKEKVLSVAKTLPDESYVEKILSSFTCPTRFSQLDIPKDTVYRMFFEAYKIRDRFTIMTLYNKYGFMDKIADEMMDKYY